MTEAAALKKLQAGSEDALRWFIRTYTPYVTAIISGIIGECMDRSDVEEVAADVFVAFWQNAQKIHAPKSYLGTVARNMSINKLRKQRFDLPLEDQFLVVDELTLDAKIEKQEMDRAVKQAVLDMPQPDREIFLRFYYYHQSLKVISEEMGINISTVKTRLHRGRERLRGSLVRYLT